MKNKNLFAYIGIVVLFFVAAVAYFEPQMEGKRLVMHDDEQFKSSVVDIESHYAETGEDPQWSGATFSGMPSYTTDFKMPTRLVWRAVGEFHGVLGYPITIVFFAMLCFWVMLLLWGKIDKLAAIIPAVAYGFSTYTILIIGAGHILKGYAIAFAPLLLGAVIYTYRSRKIWTGGALAALGGALLVVSGHPQITYYFLLVLLVLVVWKFVGAVRDKWLPQFFKATGVLVIAAVVAVGANFINLYYTAEAARTSTRGGSELAQEQGAATSGLDYEYAVAWSYGRTESLNTFIPNLMGGASDGGFAEDGAVANSLRPYNAQSMATGLPAYWGDKPFTAGPTYIGALLIFLAVLTFFVVKGRLKWWLLAITGLGFLLSWGGNAEIFTKLFRAILPGYDKFRSLDTGLVIAQWSIPMLAALCLAAVSSQQLSVSNLKKGIKWATIITGSVALFFLLLGGTMFSFEGAIDSQLPADVVSAMRSERASMLRADALRSLVFVLLGAAVLLLFAFGKIKRTATLLTLAGLVAIDLVVIDMRYVSYDKFQTPPTYRPSQADLAIMEDKTLADLAHSTFNDASAARYHRSIGGYSAAKLQRYQDIIDRYLNRQHLGVYNMLNVKYVITPEGVQVNYEANGAAWFVEEVVGVNTLAEEIAALDTLASKRVAVSSEVQSSKFKVQGSIELVSYAPNNLVYKYNSDADAVAVFSEIYYPYGWTATIDGEETDYFCADYILRAMELPAGEHTVEFSFRAPNYGMASSVTLWSSIILFAWLAVMAAINLNAKFKMRNAE